MSLKRILLLSLCILVLSGLAGCRETEITAKSAVDDEAMAELVESVKEEGILTALLV